MRFLVAIALSTLTADPDPVSAQAVPRGRDLGVPFDGATGRLNAITDVAGVEVGHTTLVSGEGKLVVGKGPVRTGGLREALRRFNRLAEPQ